MISPSYNTTALIASNPSGTVSVKASRLTKASFSSAGCAKEEKVTKTERSMVNVLNESSLIDNE